MEIFSYILTIFATIAYERIMFDWDRKKASLGIECFSYLLQRIPIHNYIKFL